ncbi:MAG: CHRD domain-containing protein [Burkholderiaceae bacterium]
MHTLQARHIAAAVAVAFGFTLAAAPALAKDDEHEHRGRLVATKLSGFNEVHFVAAPTPALRGAISSPASGSFKAAIDDTAQLITYELNYKDLGSAVQQAHIHFGQRHTVGGIVVWLCQTTAVPAPAAVAAVTPFCPQDTTGGPVTGTILPAQVLAQAAQGFAALAFDELVRAIRAGAAYVNVHSATFAPGEIRGQLEAHRHGH